jgi:hypothetical protein
MKFTFSCEMPFNATYFWDNIKDSRKYLDHIEENTNIKSLVIESKELIDENTYIIKSVSKPQIACEDILKKFFNTDEIKITTIYNSTKNAPYESKFVVTTIVPSTILDITGLLKITPICGYRCKQEFEISVNVNIIGGSYIEKLLHAEIAKTYENYPKMINEYADKIRPKISNSLIKLM